MIRNQTPAPDFSLRDQDGQQRTISDLRGSKLLLLFYYRGEFCPTSRKGLSDYADNYPRFEPLGAELVAVSVDPPETSRQLRDQLKLPFTLLSDTDFQVAESYGVYRSDDEAGDGPQPHGEPAVFIIDGDGNLAYSQIQTGPKGSANAADLALMLLYMRDNGGRYR